MVKGITFGAFDLLHPGHLMMLKEAKEHCNELTVGLHINPQGERPEKNKAIESVFERTLRLNACKYVDNVIPYETENELLIILEMLKPNIRFLDVSYENKDYTGKGIVKPYYNKRNHDYSSTNLRKRLK